MLTALRTPLLASAILLPSIASAFGGENLLSTRWCDWHHNVLTRFAAGDAGFTRNVLSEGLDEEPIDSAAAEIGWHASFVDSYAYNPLYWAMKAPERFAVAAAHHKSLIQVHFDDLFSTPQIRHTFFQYTTGTVAGLLQAKTLYESGHRDEGVAMARHLLGISLHAMQDFYSHSNWIDAPERRTDTWFAQFTRKRPALVQSSQYTGSYEKGTHLGVKSHGVMSPLMSALVQIRPVMDVLSSPISPVREMPIMEFWRKNKDNTEAITPGVLPGDGTVTLTDGLLTPPSSTAVGIPRGMLVVAPPGIALDASYLRNIAVAQRGLTDIDGDTAFRLAYQRAHDASVQWLRRLERTITAQPNGTAFWFAVKMAPPTGLHHKNFEDYTWLGFEYIAAGPYPVDSAAAQAQLPSPDSVPAPEYYLRVNLKTSTDVFAGTDADIKLRADGKEFLLDYAPVHTEGVASAIFMYNDFEGGLSTTYTVGPFDRLPATIELKNEAADVGQVLVALAESFGQAVVSIFTGIGDFFSNLFGAKADYVSQNRVMWDAQQLASIGTGWQSFETSINGGDEGKYTVFGRIRRTDSTDTENVFNVQLTTLRCDKESVFDQIKIGFPGDEPFLVAALVPLPGTVRAQRTGVFKVAHTGQSAALRAPAQGESMEFRATRSGAFDFDWTDVRVPKNHGRLSVPMCVWESDDETSTERDRMRDEFAGIADTKTKQSRETFLSTLGRATAAGWKLDTISVDAFVRGGAVGVGRVLSERPNAWIEANQRRTFLLDTTALRPSGIDPVSLQLLWDAQESPQQQPGGEAGGGAVGGTILGGPPSTLPTTTQPPAEPKQRPLKVLLVDDDVTDNNHPGSTKPNELSKSDVFYRELLKKREIAFDTHIVNAQENGPAPSKLKEYTMVIWYTGEATGGPTNTGDLSLIDQANLGTWLKEDSGRTLVLVSPAFLANVQGYVASAPSNEAKWTVTENVFLKDILGERGAQGQISRFVAGDIADPAGNAYMVSNGAVRVSFSVLNPAAATPLYLFECNPDGKGNRAVPVASWNRIGANKAIYLGFPLENVVIGFDRIVDQLIGIHWGGAPPPQWVR